MKVISMRTTLNRMMEFRANAIRDLIREKISRSSKISICIGLTAHVKSSVTSAGVFPKFLSWKNIKQLKENQI